MQLEIKHLDVSLGAIPIVHDVSLGIEQGSIVGLIGPNGAGKSTLFAALTAFANVTSGSIVFEGRKLNALTTAERARAGLVRTFQVPREFASLSVRENLKVVVPGQAGESIWRLFLDWRGVSRGEAEVEARVDETLRLVGLDHVADLAAANLSGGQKKLLELARAALLEPRMLLLDEPFNGINPVMIERVSEVIATLNEAGTTVLLVEHNLSALLRLTSTIHVMDRGTIIASGDAAEILEDERVIAAYLGNRRRHVA